MSENFFRDVEAIQNKGKSISNDTKDAIVYFAEFFLKLYKKRPITVLLFMIHPLLSDVPLNKRQC